MTAEAAATSLGTLTDIWVLIALIIPGFITFRVLSWLAAFEAKFDQFTTTIYSLICSLIVFLPVAMLHEMKSLDDIRIAIVTPQILAELLGFGVLFGIIPGIGLKFSVRKKIAFGSAWDRFANNYVGKGVTVYTTDGKKYVGWIKRMSRGKGEAKEIALGNPKLVKKNGGATEYIELGDELLFTTSVIHRILRRTPKEQSANSTENGGIGNRPTRPDIEDNEVSGRILDLKVADIQLVSGLLIAIGSTFLAIGIGFVFTVLPAIRTTIDADILNQQLINILSNHTGMAISSPASTASFQVLNGLTQLAFIYVIVGGLLLAIGFLRARIDLNKYMRQGRRTDISKKQ
jgi:hypothetical protein